MTVIGIDYGTGYHGTVVRHGDTTIIYNSGDPTIDYVKALLHCFEKGYKSVMLSSTVDHFVEDFPETYEWDTVDGVEIIVRKDRDFKGTTGFIREK